MTKVAFSNKEATWSIASNVTALVEVKSFDLEEYIFEKILTGWLLLVMTQASVTWYPFLNMFFVAVLSEPSLTRHKSSNLRPLGLMISLSSRWITGP